MDRSNNFSKKQTQHEPKMSSKWIVRFFLIMTLLINYELVASDRGFDWSSALYMPPLPVENMILSPQVLHFYPYGKSVWNHKSTAEYIQMHMHAAKVFESDADHMRYAMDSRALDGMILEFGVCTGKSINFIAALAPRSTIYGFDSFEGLPEDWQERKIAKGTFGFKDEMFRPPVLNNVRLIAGLFEETLPIFVDSLVQDRPIALMHLDADLYNSTQIVFKILGRNIRPGTIIVFDEYFNYAGWENHEHKAFQEFIVASGLRYEYISYNSLHEQVAVRIVK
jgi:hypothetical protein